MVSSRRGSRVRQYVLTQFGAGGGGAVIGCAIVMVMGT